MTTPIDARLLTLVQWLSPAFPTGAFAYSHGIERAIADGWIRDASGLECWLADCLVCGSARVDATMIRLAHAADDATEIDQTARAFAASRERLREAERQGAAFVKTANAVWGLDLPDLMLPVAVGRAVHAVDLDLDAAVALYLQAFVSNLVSAAIRLAPIGQTEGQRIVERLQPHCLAGMRETAEAGENDAFSNTFLSDIAAMRHETLEPRLFQS